MIYFMILLSLILILINFILILKDTNIIQLLFQEWVVWKMFKQLQAKLKIIKIIKTKRQLSKKKRNNNSMKNNYNQKWESKEQEIKGVFSSLT